MFRFTIRDVLWLTVVVALGAVAGLGRDNCATAEDSAFDYRNAIRAATAVLQKEHYSRRKLDDALSEKWLAAFMATLDPRRMYFLQSDVEEFQPFADRLDDQASTGDFQFPELMRTRFRQRVAWATAEARELIEAPHDYNVDESLPIQLGTYAKTGDELRERWRLRIKGELLIEKHHGRALVEVRSQLHARCERLAKQASEMTDERLCQLYLDSLARLYDPHSGYESEKYNTELAWGLVRSYRPGLTFQHSSGRWFVRGVYHDPQNPDAMKLLGWELIAIKRQGGEVVDFVERYPDEGFQVFRSPFGPLKSDSVVILELMNPATLQRKSVKWSRQEAR